MLKNKIIAKTLYIIVAINFVVAIPTFAETAEVESNASVRATAETGRVKVAPRPSGAGVNAEVKASVKVEVMEKKEERKNNKAVDVMKKEERKDAKGAEMKKKVEYKITQMKERATKEVDRRIEGLMKLEGRSELSKMTRATDKFDISALVSVEIQNLKNLKAKILADTDAETLKADIQTINKSYRIFALVIPQGQIRLAASKLIGLADTLATLSIKLEARINEAKIAGKDVTILATTLTDMNAKIADIRVQANRAISLTATLSPDNGDEAVFQANKKALLDARAKIEAGGKSAKMARKDADIIVKGLKQIRKGDIKAQATTTSTGATVAQ